MRTNYEVAHAWAHGKEAHGLKIHTSRGFFYSYSTPIGAKLEDVFIIDNSYYSATTRKHQCYAFHSTYGKVFHFDFECLRYVNTWREVTASEVIKSIIESYEKHQLSQIEVLRQSFSLSDEDKISLLDWQKIKEIASLTRCDLAKLIPNYCKLTNYLFSHKDATLSHVIRFVIGKRSYEEYIYRTMSSRKARRTRGKNVEIPEISKAAEESARRALKMHFEEIRDENMRKREEQRKMREARESAERDRRLYMSCTKDELKEKWYNSEFNGHFFYEDSGFFNGGNVLLRIKSERIETSKGISLTLDEGRRLWEIVQKLHGNEYNSLNIEVRTLCGRFTITSYIDDILTAGCHKIAFCEMQRIANDLFEKPNEKEQIA